MDMRRRWRSRCEGTDVVLRPYAVPLAAGCAIAATLLSVVPSNVFLAAGEHGKLRSGNDFVSGDGVGRRCPDISRILLRYVPAKNIFRPDGQDHSSRWDYRQRTKTRSPEEAENIMMRTGRMPRPIRLSAIQLGLPPVKKSIVGNEIERRKIAEMCEIFAVTKLQARLMIKREHHPVWQHERIMVYGKLLCGYLQPCSDTNEPVEMGFPLKFKTAFREDYDPLFKTQEQRMESHLQKKGMRVDPDLVEGTKIEQLIRLSNSNHDVPENMFVEAILDNVLDLGEVVLQHFACHVDTQAAGKDAPRDKRKLNRRMKGRMEKEYGLDVGFEAEEDKKPYEGFVKPTPQELHDAHLDEEQRVWTSKNGILPR